MQDLPQNELDSHDADVLDALRSALTLYRLHSGASATEPADMAKVVNWLIARAARCRALEKVYIEQARAPLPFKPALVRKPS